MLPRILLNGATGRMGQITAKALANASDLNLIGQLHSTDNLTSAIQTLKPDIVIDFTQASVALANLLTILTCGARPIIGTSGLTEKEVAAVKTRFPNQGGIIAPNFSLGAVLIMKSAREIARYFPETEIIEMHHSGKLDSPSGTAIRTAEILAETRQLPETSVKQSQEIIKGARGAQHQGVPIHAVRLPGLVARLQILFGAPGETITLQHNTIDRECFVPGILLACQKVMGLDTLVYGLENIL